MTPAEASFFFGQVKSDRNDSERANKNSHCLRCLDPARLLPRRASVVLCSTRGVALVFRACDRSRRVLFRLFRLPPALLHSRIWFNSYNHCFVLPARKPQESATAVALPIIFDFFHSDRRKSSRFAAPSGANATRQLRRLGHME